MGRRPKPPLPQVVRIAQMFVIRVLALIEIVAFVRR
jgi:hypothetical protein